MRTKRAIDVRNSLVIRYRSIVEEAKSTKMTAYDMHQRKIRAQRETPNDTPQWVFEFANGYYECLFDNLYKYDLEFCFKTKDDQLLSVHRDSPRYYEDEGYTPFDLNDMKSGHFWKDTDRPFNTIRRI